MATRIAIATGTTMTPVRNRATSTTPTLSVEIPVGDRKVAIRYPRDLTPDEAKKVGNVLGAIVS